MIRTRLLAALACMMWAALCTAAPAAAQERPLLLVYFTADWCPNCAVLGPEIELAVSRFEDVERIDIDITTPARRQASAKRATGHGIVAIHDAWIGRTGFAAIAARDTREVMACVTSVYPAPAIEAAMKRAIARARSTLPGHRTEGAPPACPAPAR